MSTETSNKHLETLAGHVFDNDKLVTYKWLSKELHIHVNIAKQMLWDFYQKYQSNNNIECTYLLIGHLKEKGMRVEVVKGSNLSEAKEKFNKIISEHVYSVHKPIADLELLATSGSGDTAYSAIKCDACKERTDEEMQLLRWGTTAKKLTMENVTNLKSINSTNSSKAEKNLKTDSSDSEIQSDVEMEESVPEMEPEIPMKAKSPSPPKVKHENGKRKVLKLINRTYKEGEYIVTKKEHVYINKLLHQMNTGNTATE
ncbi:PREDICTED: DNA polymerase delta subunit 3-like [Trachymyrmex septentrionalis]|uniref:DNA polymerase delta subunit 3-like n=1 Tax=Trachymyrmex septentrionalis TaxID=34720 RepID=UPI00084F1253|nr:PREDICTED: DNA polymerase delta subunit 3-like [Trachymyrmex septentrionalis]